MFSSLTSRNYRLFFFGQMISVSGNWIQTVAQSFLVLDLTHSGLALGLATGARFGPMFLFGPWGGLLADRMDKRRVLYVTQSVCALLGLTMSVLVATHTVNMPLVYAIAAGFGLTNVFDSPARQSFISELVPRDQLANAVVLNSITVNSARVFGAAIGGSVAAFLGLALCFALDGVSFAAVLAGLAMMDGMAIRKAIPPEPERGQIRAGLRYVRSTPLLLVPLIMIAVIGTLAWEFQVTLPLLASKTFHGGPGTYGAMTASMGLGAVGGGLVIAFRAPTRATALATSAMAWGAAIVATALAPNLITEYIVLLAVGYGSITFNSLAKSCLQLAADPSMRGRVMALWALAWMGSTPIGGPIVGAVGEFFGARWSLLIGGIPTVLVGMAALRVLRAIDRSSAAAPAQEQTEERTEEQAGEQTEMLQG
jgi:MFS family permease